MSAVERPTDGPDTELAAARVRARASIKRALDMSSVEDDYSVGGLVDDIMACLRADGLAVLARPAAGRDLTERDVAGAVNAWERGSYKRAVVEHLNGIARPAVACTDAPCQGTCTGCGAGEDQVCAGSCRCVASGVHDRDGYTPDMPEYTAPADDTAAPDMPSIVAGIERSYVEALNAILAAPGGSDDVDRWRGHAEAYRTVAEQLRRDHSMAQVKYGSDEWRRTHGVQPTPRAGQPVRDSQDGGA